MTLVRGIDVSSHQSVNSWTHVRTAVDFAIVKATEREDFVSSTWTRYFSGARKAGLLVGSYHFAGSSRTRTLGNAVREARHYVAALRGVGWTSGRDLPPVLDIEIDDRSNERLTAWCRDFLVEVDTLLNLREPWLKCGIYCNRDFYRNRMNGELLHRDRWLWLASWPNPAGPWPTQASQQPEGAAVWQWSDRGRISGIGGNVDCNVAIAEDLQNLAPNYYGGSADVTPQDMEEIANIVVRKLVRYELDPGSFAERVGGYSADTRLSVGGVWVGGDAWGRANHRALAIVRALVAQLLAVGSGMTPDQVQAAVAAGVRDAVNPAELAAAVAAAVDHRLDVHAVEEALRATLGALDAATPTTTPTEGS